MEKKIEENEKEELEEKIKKEIEKQNKLLRNVFIVLGVVVVLFLAVYLFIGSMSHFEYNGVDFEIEKYCDTKPCLTLYKTSIPIIYQDSVTGRVIDADYNIYLRNKPSELEKVPVNGKIAFRKNIVIGVDTDNLFCEGDWNLAIGNLQKLNILGVNIIAKNESEIKLYLPTNEYMFVNIKEGDETGIVQIEGNAYDLNVADCEILKVTERLMLEAFVKAREKPED